MEQTRVSDISYLGQDLFRCCPAYCCGSLERGLGLAGVPNVIGTAPVPANRRR
jgi:hypothetical protein